MHLLLIEDDAEAARFLAKGLRESGYVVDIASDGREWRFTPTDPWRAGNYQLLVLSIIEDAAGNRIDRPFEVDVFERVDKTPAPERHMMPFTIVER